MITGTWFFDDKYNCWCLEDVPYTERPTSPRYQQLSIFVPAPYMSAPGVVDEQGRFGPYTSRTVLVVFENNSAGYMQMPHTWLGGPRCYAEQYLERGFVYVTCGCRGRESRDAEGRLTRQVPGGASGPQNCPALFEAPPRSTARRLGTRRLCGLERRRGHEHIAGRIRRQRRL